MIMFKIIKVLKQKQLSYAVATDIDLHCPDTLTGGEDLKVRAKEDLEERLVLKPDDLYAKLSNWRRD
jgi:hypothetical protein